MGDFDGLVAIVTGGGAGIGAACVAALRAGGAQVGMRDLRPDPLPRDDGVLPVECDLRDSRAVRSAVHTVTSTFGWLDILVNNAGVNATGTVEDSDDTQWSQALDVNVLGVARASRAALPQLRHSDHAAIVNVSSVAALTGVPRQALYAASAGAVHALTLAMAADLVSQGVRVNCVCPGAVDTAWLTGDPDGAGPAAGRARDELRSRQPMGRLVSPEEVAAAVCYLAGPQAGATTGAALPVDGGAHTLPMVPRA